MAAQIGLIYARAMVELALRQGNLDEIEEAAAALAAALKADPELRQFLMSPVVGRRHDAVTRLLRGMLSASLVDAIGVILAHSRQTALPDILAAVADLADEARGRVRVQVTTALPLDAGVRARLAEALARRVAADVVLESRVDPAIVGGLVIRYKDKFVDGSVKERLAALRRQLLAHELGSSYIHEI